MNRQPPDLQNPLEEITETNKNDAHSIEEKNEEHEIKELQKPAEIVVSTSSIEVSGEGEEQLVYQQEYTKTPQVASAKHYINSSLCWITILSFEFGVLGLILNTIFSTKIPDFSYIFFFLSVTSMLKLTVNYYLLSSSSHTNVLCQKFLLIHILLVYLMVHKLNYLRTY